MRPSPEGQTKSLEDLGDSSERCLTPAGATRDVFGNDDSRCIGSGPAGHEPRSDYIDGTPATGSARRAPHRSADVPAAQGPAEGGPPELQPRDPTRYQILAEHGRGGLGRVYRARDKELQRDVALKELLKPNDLSEIRFVREALITASLEHPGIVPVHEAGRWPDGTPYYAMKLVGGRSLAKVLGEAKSRDQRLALLPRLIAVADAIAYAHSRQIIHRDIKPANVIIGDFGETIVIDWGLAKEIAEAPQEAPQVASLGAVESELTIAGSILGTPAYMAPEQARGDRVDTRSDVYAIGAMLYQLCVGRAPHPKASIKDLRRHLRGIKKDLATIVLKCLSSVPSERYTDAADLVADLRAYETGARIAARHYSPAAMLSHWIHHHKRLALSSTAITVVALTLGSLAVREILSQRDHAARARGAAEAAQETAVFERDSAIRAQAAMLIESDPTKARDLLASQTTLGPQEALLMARAHGAGTAERIVSFAPFKVHRALPDSALKTLAVAASDNKLRTIDLSSGHSKIVHGELLEPALVLRTSSGLTYARRGSAGPELFWAARPTHPIALGGLLQHPDNEAVESVSGLYILDAFGDLSLITGSGNARRIHKKVLGIYPFRDGLLACTDRDLLEIRPSGAVTRIDRCQRSYRGRNALATAGDDYVVQTGPSTASVYRKGTRHELSITPSSSFAMAASGLIVGISKPDDESESRQAWFLRPDAKEPTFATAVGSTPVAAAADGQLAAWGYADGVARVRDTLSGATWTFVGHPASIAWLFISEDQRRLVTVGGPDIRVWRIPSTSLKRIGSITCGVFNLAPSPDGRHVAFDCSNGEIRILDRIANSPTIYTAHKHATLAFGVTWRDNEICSSAWDGTVICTDIATRLTKDIGRHPRPIRSIDGGSNVVAYAVEDGGVWAHYRHASQSRWLYRHAAEPYRVAVSEQGDVASGAKDGSLMTQDRFGVVHTARTPHAGRVFDMSWRGHTLYTSSWDGTIRTWDRRLNLISSSSGIAPIRELRLLGTGWIASSGGSQIWIRLDGVDLRLETGSVIRDLAVSHDGRFAAAYVGRDVLLYDTHERSLASIRIGDRSTGYVQFVDSTTLIAAGTGGEIVSISVNNLPFAAIFSKEMRQ